MKKISILLACLSLYSVGMAQQEEEQSPIAKIEQKVQEQEEALTLLKKLKVSGYIQTQWQHGEKDASLRVGTKNDQKEDTFSRLGIRRGRIKFTYDAGLASSVFQLDITEKGVGIKDAYLNVKDPWLQSSSLRIGVFDRPFGNEISYSSSRRESPERSLIFNTLFPNERDLGAMLTLQAPKTSPLNFLKLEAGLFAGNGIKPETDSRKDFIGHLSMTKNLGDNVRLGLGTSYYNGGVYQGTDKEYSFSNGAFQLSQNSANKGKFAKREYYGVDGQLVVLSPLGMTHLRAEYIAGVQPGTASGTQSPNFSKLPEHDTFIRTFSGGYAILIQDFGTLPLSAVLKYDWYDPNTKTSGNEIGQGGTSRADLAYTTFGAGLLWRISNNLRMQAYYDVVTNEKSSNLVGYEKDRKDNVFTLRLQYKF
ncbi:MAG: hypothetical protein Q3998_01365 [Porphyromonas sp.]|nr:hypothetical protein [Porphyromonas sp.]